MIKKCTRYCRVHICTNYMFNFPVAFNKSNSILTKKVGSEERRFGFQGSGNRIKIVNIKSLQKNQ